MLEKAKKKYRIPETNLENKEIIKQETNINQENKESELSQKLSKLSKEQQDALLKLLERWFYEINGMWNKFFKLLP